MAAPAMSISEVIQDMKREGRFQTAALAIHAGNDVAGSLHPVDATIPDNLPIVEKMCRWRSVARTSFLTVFEPSVDKTRSYLTDLVLVDPTRILFLAAGQSGDLVGNIGLCNITETSAEIDNVLRGEASPSPKFMKRVHSALTDWARRALGVQNFYLNVLSSNPGAIKFYAEIGYEEVSLVPLRKEVFEGGYRLVPENGQSASDSGLFLVKMVL